MTDPESTPQETEIDPESSHDEATATGETADEATVTGETAVDPNQEAEKKGLTADYQIEGEKAGVADYQTRLEKFDEVESTVPVVSTMSKTSDREKSDEV